MPQIGISNKREKKKTAFWWFFFKIWTRTKKTISNIIEKRKKSRFLPSGFLLQKSSLQNQTPTFTVIFSPFLSLEVHTFVLFRFPGRDTAFCSSASWPCLNFQRHDCIACWEIVRLFDWLSFLPPTFVIFSRSDLARKCRACCNFQWSQIQKYAVTCRRIWTVFYSKDCQARFLKVTTLRRFQLLKDYTGFHRFHSLKVHRSSKWLQERNTFSDLSQKA